MNKSNPQPACPACKSTDLVFDGDGKQSDNLIEAGYRCNECGVRGTATFELIFKSAVVEGCTKKIVG